MGAVLFFSGIERSNWPNSPYGNKRRYAVVEEKLVRNASGLVIGIVHIGEI